MQAKKVIPICGCIGCPSITWEYPSEEAKAKAEALKADDCTSPQSPDPTWALMGAKMDLKQAYCMENDEPPYQFVLRPIEGDIGDVPEWCELPDAPGGLHQYFLKPVKLDQPQA